MQSQTGIPLDTDHLAVQAKAIRRQLVQMVASSKSSHVGAGLSIVDVLALLYFRILKIDPANPVAAARDRFILSKAHASAALYATLAERGFYDRDLLKQFYVDGGILPGHLDYSAVPGVETSGGSLGHGLPIAIGMALANQRSQNPGRIFVVLGDGECDEGSVWEAAMAASQLRLGNLTAIVDCNRLQGLGWTDEICSQRNLPDRWRSFGWEVIEAQGHDFQKMDEAFAAPQKGPKVVLLHTIKGKGVSFMENKLLWHYRSPDETELKNALRELE